MAAPEDDRPARLTLYRRDGTPAGHTLIDHADRGHAEAHTWRLSSDGYAVRSERIGDVKRTVYLHREILAAPAGLVADHANGNRLDNRRENLRTATPSQNNANGRDRARASKYRGVYPHRPTGRWIAQISIDGKVRHLGIFDDQESAARAYDHAARDQWGAFARTNDVG